MLSLLALSRDDLARLARDADQPAYRAGQLFHWLHARRARRVADMANLPAAWRRHLSLTHDAWRLEEAERRVSRDGLTEKWLFRADGGAVFESVLIREKRGHRRTVCLSCMAGCPLGCVFCATGLGGHLRDLTAEEMVEQAYQVDEAARGGGLAAVPSPPPGLILAGLSHVVYMGMGEPLLNLDGVLDSVRVLTDPQGMALSPRRVTLSTVGIPEGLRRLARDGRPFRLAWSLHAARQELREKLMPAARRWPLAEVLPEVARYAEAASRRVTVEYALMDGVNDTVADADALARLAGRQPWKINLIPYNRVAGCAWRASPPAAVAAFRGHLEKGGLSVTVRAAKGRDIAAACGQLAPRNL